MLRLGANTEDRGKLLVSCSAESKAASSQCRSGGAGTPPADVKALPHVLARFKHHWHQDM